MLSFSHPNVMPLTGLCIDGDMPLLIMPFMINGSVLEYVKQHKERLYFTENASNLEVRMKWPRKIIISPITRLRKFHVIFHAQYNILYF